MKIKNKEYNEEYEWYEGKIYVELLKRDIDVVIDKGVPIEFENKSIKHLLNLDENVIKELCTKSIKYSDEFLDDVGEELIVYESYRDVLNHIQGGLLTISESEDESDYNEPAFSLGYECDWEIEHGLEWTVRGDKVLYVGAYEMVSPYYEEDCELYKNIGY